MDDAVPESSTEEYSVNLEKEADNTEKFVGKRQKLRITSIVDASEILSEEEIRCETVQLERIKLVQVSQNESPAEWKILRDVCKDMLTCLQWMTRRRLIANTFLCPKCKQHCAFQLRRDRTDKYNWTCNPCNFKKSLREGSFFAGSHLSLPTILQLIYLWSLRTKHEDVQNRLCIKQRHTIVDWFAFIREICARKVLDSPQHIGGLHEDTLEGVVAYFGVFDFTHLRDRKEETYWVVLGIESGTDHCFVVPIDSCNPYTVVAVLRRYVEPGSILIGRPFELSASSSTETSHQTPQEFLQFAHDYSITLDLNSDFSSSSSVYDVKETELWKLIQRRFKSKSDLFCEEPTSTSLFQSYIQEAIWRRMHSDSQDLFSALIADISNYYPV